MQYFYLYFTKLSVIVQPIFAIFQKISVSVKIPVKKRINLVALPIFVDFFSFKMYNGIIAIIKGERTMNPSSPCAFELEGNRYSWGATPADLKEFELQTPSQASTHVRFGQRTALTMVHCKTNARITLFLTNYSRTPCRLMNASIYGLSASFENDPHLSLKIFHNPDRPAGLGSKGTFSDAIALLGRPAAAQKAYTEEVVEERTRTETVTEVTEEEWDDYIDFYEEEVEYEVPYEDRDFVHHDASALWRTENCVLLLHHNVNITSIDFYKAGEAPEKLDPKPVTGFKRTFLKIRGVCCFTTLLSTIGLLGLIFSNQLPEFLQTLTGFAVLFGWASTLFACPWHLIKVAGKVIGWSFAFGIAILTVGCVITTPIGIILAGALLLFFQSIVTIPYYFKKIRPELNK